MRFYNTEIKKFVDKWDLIVYQGFVLPSGYYEGGLKLLVNPSNRITRKNSVYDEFLNSYASKNKDPKAIDRYFSGISVFIKYKKRMAVLSGADINVTLQSKFPNNAFKNF